jgi:hypothetical protein
VTEKVCRGLQKFIYMSWVRVGTDGGRGREGECYLRVGVLSRGYFLACSEKVDTNSLSLSRSLLSSLDRPSEADQS